jgi:electron transfer flavoprotein alpha subunit
LLPELLAGGKLLSAKLGTSELTAIAAGNASESQLQGLIGLGADKVLTFNHPLLQKFKPDIYASTLAGLAAKESPEIILVGSTKNGKEVAARLAARLQTGCTQDCSALTVTDDGWLETKRIVYSGSAIVTAVHQKKPQIASVLPRTFEAFQPTERTGQVVQTEVEVDESRTEVVSVEQIQAAELKIEEAKIVVCAGRGIGKKEDFQPLQELAALMGGQVSNTRPLAEDRKWFTGWVGLSGKKIKPTLYVGCGISGMIQHVAGMRDSQIVVAINSDPEAAIFEVADYVVVGDLYEIVPAIVEKLKTTLKQ